MLLRKKLTIFLGELSNAEFLRWIPDFPVFLVNDRSNSLYMKLSKEGVLISAFAYPDINGPKIERIVINAAKTDEDISFLTALINKHKK
jgi:7-keto-8-aminopelargonate synthetase-like enzyme